MANKFHPMKQKQFATMAIAFAATTAIIGTAAATISPVEPPRSVYVRRDEATAGILYNAGVWNITDSSPSGTVVTVLVDDERTATPVDTRSGRTATDALLRTSPATILDSDLVITEARVMN